MLINVTLPWLAMLQHRAPNASDVHAKIIRTHYVTNNGVIVHQASVRVWVRRGRVRISTGDAVTLPSDHPYQERMTLWIFIRGSICPTCPYVAPSDDSRRLASGGDDRRRRLVEAQDVITNLASSLYTELLEDMFSIHFYRRPSPQAPYPNPNPKPHILTRTLALEPLTLPPTP